MNTPEDFDNPCCLLVIKNAHMVLVDAAHYHWLDQFSWQMQRSGYVDGWVNREKISMHILVNKTPRGIDTHHRNAVRSDNRSCNLETVTRRDNQRNRLKTRGKSKFKGAFRHDLQGRVGWHASIGIEGKTIYLGHFKNEIDAAKAYDAAALKHFGRFARTNFPPPSDPSHETPDSKEPPS